MEQSETQHYKKPLSIDEQIEYLELKKNVTFEKTSKEEASIILQKYNYINIITPYKFLFAKRDKNQQIIRDENNKHIYEEPVDFSLYWYHFQLDKYRSLLLFRTIFEFESAFNSTISQVMIKKYDLGLSSSFNDFISKIKSTKNKELQKNDGKNRFAMAIDNLEKNAAKYKTIFTAFDRLSLGQLLSLYELLDYKDKKIIYNKLGKFEDKLYILFCDEIDGRIKDFTQKIHMVNQIRNCTYHSSNLSILLNYRNVENNDRRKNSDKNNYKKLIKKMLECKLK